jgi:hypothetical protein
MFFKFTCLGNAGGYLAKLLVIVQVKTMPENTFFVREVPGLAHTSECGCSGYLLLVPKRSGNDASNTWFHQGYLIPEIKKADEQNRNLEFGGMKSAIYIDGESSILTAGMKPEVLGDYRASDITGVKGYPAGTSKHQSWDVATIFMDIKAGVRKIARDGTDVSNEILQNGIAQALVEFSVEFPTATMPENFKKHITFGCEVLTHTMKTSAVTGPKLKKSFFQNGQHCNTVPSFVMPGEDIRTTIDSRKIMAQCTTKISDAELLNFESHMEELVYECGRAGRTDEALMDSLNIVKQDDHVNRDDLVLCRKPPLIFTHEATEASFNLWQHDRSPDEIIRRKTTDAAQKLYDKSRISEEKKEATKRKREVEKERFTNLSKEEQVAEKAESKIAKKRLSDDLKEAKSAALIRAKDLLISVGRLPTGEEEEDDSDSDDET